MGESILQLRQIRKSFDNTEVLKGIDLEAGQGEFITLLGASGCGKTTTLRIIAGLELPDAGQVILEGQDITNREPNKRDVNTVFQNYALFPHMNVSDNVGYGLKTLNNSCPHKLCRRAAVAHLLLVQIAAIGNIQFCHSSSYPYSIVISCRASCTVSGAEAWACSSRCCIRRSR